MWPESAYSGSGITMRTINMRAVDARAENLITQAAFEKLLKEHGPVAGRNYPISVQVE